MISTVIIVAFFVEGWASSHYVAVSTFVAHVLGVKCIVIYG